MSTPTKNEAVVYDGTGKPINLSNPDGMAVSHVFTFAGLLQGAWNTYYHNGSHEGFRHNRENALHMRNDLRLEAAFQERKRAVKILPWRIEVEDESDPKQAVVKDLTTKILNRIPRFRRMLGYLLEAVWWGRYGSQLLFAWEEVCDAEGVPYQVMQPVKHDPIFGDKLGFRHDGTPYVRVYGAAPNIGNIKPIYSTQGPAIPLVGTLRERFLIHTYNPLDADYFDIEGADAKFGVGLSSLGYWQQWVKNEFASWVTEFFEKVGLGLVMVEFESGNTQSEAAADDAIKNLGKRSVIKVPRAAGGTSTWGNTESIRILEVPASGATMIREWIEYFDESFERLIIGQSMSSGSDAEGSLGGSGRANLAKDTKSQIIEDDALDLEETITGSKYEPGLIHTIVKYSFPWVDFPVQFKLGIKPDNSKERMEAIQAAVGMGVAVKEADVREACNVDAPEHGDPIVGGQAGHTPGKFGEGGPFEPPFDQDPQDEDQGGDEGDFEPTEINRWKQSKGKRGGKLWVNESTGEKSYRDHSQHFGDDRHMEQYAADKKTGGHWVTMGGDSEEGGGKHHGGHPVLLDGEGRIIGGNVPRSWQGRHISEAFKPPAEGKAVKAAPAEDETPAPSEKAGEESENPAKDAAGENGSREPFNSEADPAASGDLSDSDLDKLIDHANESANAGDDAIDKGHTDAATAGRLAPAAMMARGIRRGEQYAPEQILDSLSGLTMHADERKFSDQSIRSQHHAVAKELLAKVSDDDLKAFVKDRGLAGYQGRSNTYDSRASAAPVIADVMKRLGATDRNPDAAKAEPAKAAEAAPKGEGMSKASKEPHEMTREAFDAESEMNGNPLSTKAHKEAREYRGIIEKKVKDKYGRGGLNEGVIEAEAKQYETPDGRTYWDIIKAGESAGPEDHRSAVASALAAGKPVPPEVLADYPDLAPAPAKAEAKPAKAAEAKRGEDQGKTPEKPREVNENLIEYTVRDLFKKKSLDSAVRSVVKKFHGTNNMFLGGNVSVTESDLKKAVLDRVAKNAIEGASKMKDGMGHFSLGGSADKFNIDEKVLADHISKHELYDGDANGLLKDHPGLATKTGAPAKAEAKPAKAKEPHEMTREEFSANIPGGYAYRPHDSNAIATYRPDGKIELTDAFFEHSPKDRKHIIAHEKAHGVVDHVSKDADQFWPLVNSGLLGKYDDAKERFVGISKGQRNADEVLADAVADYNINGEELKAKHPGLFILAKHLSHGGKITPEFIEKASKENDNRNKSGNRAGVALLGDNHGASGSSGIRSGDEKGLANMDVPGSVRQPDSEGGGIRDDRGLDGKKVKPAKAPKAAASTEDTNTSLNALTEDSLKADGQHDFDAIDSKIDEYLGKHSVAELKDIAKEQGLAVLKPTKSGIIGQFKERLRRYRQLAQRTEFRPLN